MKTTLKKPMGFLYYAVNNCPKRTLVFLILLSFGVVFFPYLIFKDFFLFNDIGHRKRLLPLPCGRSARFGRIVQRLRTFVVAHLLEKEEATKRFINPKNPFLPSGEERVFFFEKSRVFGAVED